LDRAQTLQRELTAAISQDAAAFGSLMDVWRDKDLTGQERERAIELATRHAGEVPLLVARHSRDAAQIATSVTALGNSNAVTDAAAAAVMARAAVQIAAMNVKINATGLQDQDLANRWRQELDDLQEEVERLAAEAISTAQDRGGF
jgi:formiminotetrahydrofolate cyclodeaminase